MERIKLKKKIKSLILILNLFLILILSSLLNAEKAECERAYSKCLITAILLGIAYPGAGLAWGASCLMGYAWCLEFFGEA